MTAYFAVGPTKNLHFQVPGKIFETLIKWNQHDFSHFFSEDPLRKVRLSGHAAFMLGTTIDLINGLETMLANGMTDFLVDRDDLLVIHYVRIQNISLSPKTRSLVCIAPLWSFWFADTYKDAGKALAFGTTPKPEKYKGRMTWEPLFHGQKQIGIRTRDLIDVVLPEAKDKKAWEHFRDP